LDAAPAPAPTDGEDDIHSLLPDAQMPVANAVLPAVEAELLPELLTAPEQIETQTPAASMVKALHPYVPTAPDQITMSPGDMFTLVDHTGIWWKVKAATGQEGLVPSNYLERVAVVAPSGVFATAENDVLSPFPLPPAPTPVLVATIVLPVAPTMVKALHPYTPTAANQIAMVQGDILTLIDGTGIWWKVKAATGQAGLVPSNYVEKLPDATTATAVAATTQPVAASAPASVPVLVVTTGVVLPPVAPTMVKALHPYIPTAANQIAMVQGEILTLIDGTDIWWKVKAATGEAGLVPSNYVVKIVSASGVAETSEA
jgi:hypothetical protein